MKQNRDTFAVGLMTGTSLDGVDVALVKISEEIPQDKEDAATASDGVRSQLLHFISRPYSPQLREKIETQCHNESSTVAEICSLNMALGEIYRQSVQQLLDEVAVKRRFEPALFVGFSGKPDFIASHGQTIYHLPPSVAKERGYTASTLQIGDPSPLAYHFHCDVYFNFRMMDIVAGGDGAPLVPMTEYLLYRHPDYHRLLQNIGGIGNVTLLPKGARIEEVTAFDTGPGNMMINDAMRLLYQREYDQDGEIAQKGQLIPALFEELQRDPYIAQQPPKSTGREYFGAQYALPLLKRYKDHAPEDLIHTLTRFTAYSIAESYRRFIFPYYQIDQVIVAGGGAYNLALMRYLQDALPQIALLTQEDLGFSSDAKEAIAFALLGYLTKARRIGNLPTATGASQAVVLGQICPNPFPEQD
ncbi:anhydro-N-acetylmuramic acid kinase AnmK [Ignatzschineria cameli]|uniref:anhydro-N-acetylmuramic acid kinase AnmK n=1 Tax=Ignatzschineria cameli TaxID=2182793 RepID=UPI000D608671|nr:anhydro-N-acetylmuramic acid kinase AnmK [Ignatzschineria cameli]PWD83548.1 anhydro-N-acetylmuramic acid kinase [Ignatzschineria cameli]